MKFKAVVMKSSLAGHLRIEIEVDDQCGGTLILTEREWLKFQKICRGRLEIDNESINHPKISSPPKIEGGIRSSHHHTHRSHGLR